MRTIRDRMIVSASVMSMWGEPRDELNSLNYLCMSCPDRKPHIILDCINYISVNYHGHQIIWLETILAKSLAHYISKIFHDQVILDYTVLFSLTTCE